MIMKKYNKFLILFISSIVLLINVGCEEADSDKKWGNSLLYIPQAVLQSGGSNNNYVVKVDKSSTSVNIVVGLYRSGLEKIENVAVDVVIDKDSLLTSIDMAMDSKASNDYAIYKTAQLLPDSYYTLPSKMSLQDGERESYIELVLDVEKLNEDPFFIPGNRYILPIRIINPTRYELNYRLSLLMLIIEVK